MELVDGHRLGLDDRVLGADHLGNGAHRWRRPPGRVAMRSRRARRWKFSNGATLEVS
jgi:hypothetical protein